MYTYVCIYIYIYISVSSELVCHLLCLDVALLLLNSCLH